MRLRRATGCTDALRATVLGPTSKPGVVLWMLLCLGSPPTDEGD